MVCFIKVTIIQWYIVLNSQKYEQVFTARHTHNRNTSLRNEFHTDDGACEHKRPQNPQALFSAGEGGQGGRDKGGKKKTPETPNSSKAKICSMKLKALKEKTSRRNSGCGGSFQGRTGVPGEGAWSLPGWAEWGLRQAPPLASPPPLLLQGSGDRTRTETAPWGLRG